MYMDDDRANGSGHSTAQHMSWCGRVTICHAKDCVADCK